MQARLQLLMFCNPCWWILCSLPLWYWLLSTGVANDVWTWSQPWASARLPIKFCPGCRSSVPQTAIPNTTTCLWHCSRKCHQETRYLWSILVYKFSSLKSSFSLAGKLILCILFLRFCDDLIVNNINLRFGFTVTSTLMNKLVSSLTSPTKSCMSSDSASPTWCQPFYWGE